MSAMATKLSPSLRDYLEAIYSISSEKGGVRAKDIAERMGVKRASVTGALHALAERSLVNYSPYSVITLTQKGKTLAIEEIRRFQSIKRFYENVLSLSSREAERGARMTKQSVPNVMVKRLTQLMDFLESCPRGYFEWKEEYGFFCPPDKCDNQGCKNLLLNRLNGEENL